MELNGIYKVKIIDQETNGRGVAKLEDFVIFVEGALTSEECEVKITKLKKSFAEAEVVKIIKASPERIENDCPYYPLCGGCDLRHQEYNSQLKFKQNKISTALTRIGKLTNITVNEVVPFNKYNYRNKVTLKVKENTIGFYKRNSYEIVDIDNCLISDNKINEIIKVIKKFISDYKNHNIKEISIRVIEDKMISISSEGFNLIEEFISYFEDMDITSIVLNNEVIYGDEVININLFDYKFEVDNNSFFQVNTKQTENLYNKVLEYASLTEKDTVLDLYSGVGTITTVLSKYAKKVVGIEIVKEAVINADENKILNNIENIEFFNGPVENIIDKITDKISVIVLDPPRNGSDQKTLESILKLKPKKIIYVSCNPETLARDLKVLSEKYLIKEITPFDMFPETNHVESVTLLVKKVVKSK